MLHTTGSLIVRPNIIANMPKIIWPLSTNAARRIYTHRIPVMLPANVREFTNAPTPHRSKHSTFNDTRQSEYADCLVSAGNVGY